MSFNFRSFHPHFAIFLGLVLLLGGGCASHRLTKPDEVAQLPAEFTAAEQEKFEVKEVGAVAALTPVPTPTPTPVLEKGKKSKKKKSAEKPEPSVTPAAAHEAATYPHRRPAKDPIWVGEKLVYSITYFGMPAGDITMEVLPFKEINHRKVYHLSGLAESSSVFSLVYKVHDTIESFMDYEGLFSHRMEIKIDESKQTRDVLELYDQEKSRAFFWSRWNHWKKGYNETKEFQSMQRFSQDSLSALYFVRTLPFTSSKPTTFPVVSEGKTWEAVVSVVDKEKMDTPMGEVEVLKVKPDHKLQGVLQKSGDNFVWLTNDDRRIITRIEAKVKIGTVVIVLKSFQPGTPP